VRLWVFPVEPDRLVVFSKTLVQLVLFVLLIGGPRMFVIALLSYSPFESVSHCNSFVPGGKGGDDPIRSSLGAREIATIEQGNRGEKGLCRLN
jgi:hypothetical protein